MSTAKQLLSGIKGRLGIEEVDWFNPSGVEAEGWEVLPIVRDTHLRLKEGRAGPGSPPGLASAFITLLTVTGPPSGPYVGVQGAAFASNKMGRERAASLALFEALEEKSGP